MAVTWNLWPNWRAMGQPRKIQKSHSEQSIDSFLFL